MFQKKLIAVAVAGVATLGLSSVALANGGGYGAAPVAATPAPVAAAPATAPESSFYVGVGAGYGDNHWDNVFNNGNLDSAIAPYRTYSVKDTGFAGRVFAGYNFNRYLAAELGWTYLPASKVTVNLNGGTNDTASGQFKVKQYTVDVLGKVTAPIADGFGVYAKAGAAYLHSKFDNFALATPTKNANYTLNGGSEDHWGPAFGVGASYDVTPNFVADVSWMRYSGQGKVGTGSKYQPNPDVGLVSLAYKFPVSM